MSDHNQYNMPHNSQNNSFLENENVKDNDELLIDAVRAYPHLYNHQNRDFKDNLMKENSWKEIALAVNMSASDCQNRWVRLREKFGKERRQRELDSKSGSGVSRRNVFTYYENMLFLNNHIKKRKTHTNVSNLKCLQTIEVTRNQPDTDISSAISPPIIKKSRQEMNLSMDSVIIESTEPSTSKIASQFSKVDEIPIQPFANFLTPFKENFLSNTGPISSSMTSLENDQLSSGSTGSPRHFPDVSDNLESDELTRSSVFSTRESTSSPASTVFQTTPLSRKPLKKKNNSTELESSLILLCQTMHQRFQDNHNSEVIGGPDDTFARLIVNQLEKLSSHEKQKRQQAIMQILYAPYDS